MSSTTYMRKDFSHARTIVVKIGTEVVNEVDGLMSMGRMGAIVEQLCRLHMEGKRIVLVSSGAVGAGRQLLRKQYLLSGSLQSHVGGYRAEQDFIHPKASAAAGQSGLQSMYDALFSRYDVATAQILISDNDFKTPEIGQTFRGTVRALLDVGVIPIINENDVVTRRTLPLKDSDNLIAWDNDSLASLVAQEIGADLMILMTDVDGVERKTKDKTQKNFISSYSSSDVAQISKASRVGPIGQKDKIDSCIRAVTNGPLKAAVIANASQHFSILRIVAGEEIGTVFFRPNATSSIVPSSVVAHNSKL